MLLKMNVSNSNLALFFIQFLLNFQGRRILATIALTLLAGCTAKSVKKRSFYAPG
jgi:hypothetical protein